jgi:hypothetical protein
MWEVSSELIDAGVIIWNFCLIPPVIMTLVDFIIHSFYIFKKNFYVPLVLELDFFNYEQN